MKHAATPFDYLMGTQRSRLPGSGGAHLVLDGQRVTSAHAIKKAARQDALDLAELDAADADADAALRARQAVAADKKALAKAKAAARYQRQRANPEAMAKRQAWYEANKAQVLAYKKRYDKRHRAQQRPQKLAHQKRAYAANPELMRQRSRDYYARNREAILARAKAKRDAAKQTPA